MEGYGGDVGFVVDAGVFFYFVLLGFFVFAFAGGIGNGFWSGYWGDGGPAAWAGSAAWAIACRMSGWGDVLFGAGLARRSWAGRG